MENNNQEQKQNNTSEIEKQIAELFEQAPKEIQDALNSVELTDKIQEIGKNHGLHVDTMGHLFDEITMVMLGLENPNELVDSLERKLKVPKEKVNEVVKDIDEKVFEPVRDSLKKQYIDDEDETLINTPQNLPTEKSAKEKTPEEDENQENHEAKKQLNNENPVVHEKLSQTMEMEKEDIKTMNEKKDVYVVDPYREQA